MGFVRAARQWTALNNHLMQAAIWGVLGIPTVLWWKESILWVAIMSLYANVEASMSAHESKKPPAWAAQLLRDVAELKERHRND